MYSPTSTAVQWSPTESPTTHAVQPLQSQQTPNRPLTRQDLSASFNRASATAPSPHQVIRQVQQIDHSTFSGPRIKQVSEDQQSSQSIPLRINFNKHRSHEHHDPYSYSNNQVPQQPASQSYIPDRPAPKPHRDYALESEEESESEPEELDKFQQLLKTVEPFLQGLQPQHSNPTTKSNGCRNQNYPTITYNELVVYGATSFLDKLTEYNALSDVTDSMQIQNLARGRGFCDTAKLHWQSFTLAGEEWAPVFDMSKRLPTADPTKTQICLLRGKMAMTWKTPSTLEHAERILMGYKLTPPDKRGLWAFLLAVTKEISTIKRPGMDKEMETTTMFLKVVRKKHPGLHQLIIDKYDQMNLTSPLQGDDVISHEYSPTKITKVVKSIHQAALREVPEPTDTITGSPTADNQQSYGQRGSRPPPLLAHSAIAVEATKPPTIKLPPPNNSTTEYRTTWMRLPPASDLQPSNSRDACKGCGLDHPSENCPFIFHQLYRDKGIFELFYPVLFRQKESDIQLYLTHLATHGFMKTMSQAEADETVNTLTHKRKAFQRGQDDPDRDSYRRNKARYGDHPTPPDTNRSQNYKNYSNRTYRRSPERNRRSPERERRNINNRPSWEKKPDQPKAN